MPIQSRTTDNLKTARSVKTLGQLLDRRRARSASGALLELSAMANERERLEREQDRLARRRLEIQQRLAEMAEKEAWLHGIATSSGGSGAIAVSESSPVPMAGEPGPVVTRQFMY